MRKAGIRQRAQIVFHCQQVVATAINDLLDALSLTADGVDRDDATLEHQDIEQALDRRNLMAFAACAFLGQAQAASRQIRADHVQCRVVPVTRATQRLAVKRDHTGHDADQAGNPGRKHCSKTAASSRRNTRPNVSCEDAPSFAGMYWRSHVRWSSAHSATSTHVLLHTGRHTVPSESFHANRAVAPAPFGVPAGWQTLPSRSSFVSTKVETTHDFTRVHKPLS